MEETRWQALAVFEAGKDNSIKQFKAHEAEIKAAGRAARRLQVPGRARPPARPPFAPPARSPAPTPPAAADPPSPPRPPAAATPADAREADRGAAGGAPGGRGTARRRSTSSSGPKLVVPLTVVAPFLLVGAPGVPAGPVARLGRRRRGRRRAWRSSRRSAAFIGLRQARAGAGRPGLPAARRRRWPRPSGSSTSSKKWAKTTYEQQQGRGRGQAPARGRQGRGAVQRRPSPRPRNAGRKAAKEADAKYPPLLQAVADRRDAALKEADEVYPRRLKEIQERFQRESDRGQRDLPQGQGGDRPPARRGLGRPRGPLARRPRRGRRRSPTSVRDRGRPPLPRLAPRRPRRLGPARRPSPTGMRFGSLALDLADIPQGIPVDPRLKAYGPTRHDLPALTAVPRPRARS